MNKNILIIGAGGHGLVIADIAKLNGYTSITFLDDSLKKQYPYQIIGRINDFINYVETHDFFIAIGDNKKRKEIFELLFNNSANMINLIHPSAVVASDVYLETGIVIMAGVVVNSGSVIKKGCIINTATSIDHENFIDEFSHISPGCHLAGNVKIGEETWIGIGSNIINNVLICSKCMIGAGTIVLKDIREPGKYVGLPIRKL